MATTKRTESEVVRRGFDALNERDREGFVELHREDAVLHDGGEDIHGIEAIAELEFAYFEAFPDLALTPETIVAEDDTVAVRWTVTGTHDGEFNGADPTGEEFEFSVMGMFRVGDGSIAEVWLVADQLGLLEQLGVVEPPRG